MLFGPSRYKAARKGQTDDSQRRIILLLLFLGLAVCLVVAVPPLARLVGPGAGEGRGSGAVRSWEEELEPGEARVLLPTGPDSGALPVQGPEPPRPPGEPAPFQPDPDALSAVEDGTDQLEPDAISHLFHRIRTRPDWTNEGPLPSTAELTRRWLDFVGNPAAHRGEEIVLVGTLVATTAGRSPLEVFGLPPGNGSGLDRYYRSFLFTGQTIFLVATWRQPEVPIEDRDDVRVRGLFVKLYENEVEHEGEIRRASVPVIVADSFTRLPPRETPGILRLIAPAAIGLLGAFVFVLVLCLLIFRSGDDRYRLRVSEVRKRLGLGSPARARPPRRISGDTGEAPVQGRNGP